MAEGKNVLGTTTVSPHPLKSEKQGAELQEGTEESCEIKIVQFSIPPGGKLGLRISYACQISSIKDDSAAKDVLRPGDIITAINGVSVVRYLQLEEEICKVKNRVFKFDIYRTRAPYILPDTEVSYYVPKGYDVVPGYQFIFAYMRMYPGANLGIHTMSLESKVFVTRAPPNTLSGEVFRRGDAILAVDDQPVTDIETCRTCLTNALTNKKFVKVLIERPVDDIAKRRIKAVLNYQLQLDIDPRMSKDIQDICDVAKLNVGKDPLKSIYRDAEKNVIHRKLNMRLTLAETHEIVLIGSDPFNQELLQQVVPRFQQLGVPQKCRLPKPIKKKNRRSMMFGFVPRFPGELTH